MPLTDLNNTAEVSGLLDGSTTGDSASSTVIMVEGLTVTKTADKASWAGGPLEYTISIDNQTGHDYTEVIITDLLDPAQIELITDTVFLGTTQLVENTDFTYNAASGMLTVDRTPKISVLDGESVSLSFQVSKA